MERTNHTILMMVSIRVERDEGWDRHLPEITMAYRASIHESIGFTPYQLLLGYLPIDVRHVSAPEPNLEIVPYARELQSRMSRAFGMV